MKTLFGQLRVRVARNREELEKAFALVYREYLRKGYTNETPSGLRFSLYNALPEATTIIALTQQDEVIATATIIPDSPLGIPIDSILQKELSRLRKGGRVLCEVTMLAVDVEYLNNHVHSLAMGRRIFMFAFFKVLLDFCHAFKKCDYMCIAIHPKHNRFFKELLFRDLGPVKFYPDVNYAPALTKYVNMHFIKTGFSKPGKELLYDIFVRKTTDPESFRDKFVLGPEDLRYFFVERSCIFESASKSRVEFIQHCYEADIIL